MNKTKDDFESKAYLKGYDDYIWNRSSAVCPYTKDSEEAKCWYLGFNDAESFANPRPSDIIGDW